MKVSIFGLGYVGAVTAGCLSRDEHDVIGVDVNSEKIEMIQNGRSPIIEQGLEELLQKGVDSGRLRVTANVKQAIEESEVSLICVGTPSNTNGALNLSFVKRVSQEIAAEVGKKKISHTVIIRSTILPGTTESIREIFNKYSPGIPVYIGFNPEFLREGSAIKDYDSPAYTIIGTNDYKAEEAVRNLYATVDAPVIVTEPAVAEMIKYTANTWHAIKIAFANEIGRVAKNVGVDGRKVMEIIVQDNKLNISPAYMRPGFAYGGSCLPKDVRALTHYAKLNDLDIPLLNSLSISNMSQIKIAVQQVLSKMKTKIGILGLAFKPGTDDLRESPAVELAERLMGKGCEIRIYDPFVYKAKLMGSNKEYIEKKIPHLTNLLVKDAEELLNASEVIVITHESVVFKDVIRLVKPEVSIIDLAGLTKNHPEGKSYEGIAW